MGIGKCYRSLPQPEPVVKHLAAGHGVKHSSSLGPNRAKAKTQSHLCSHFNIFPPTSAYIWNFEHRTGIFTSLNKSHWIPTMHLAVRWGQIHRDGWPGNTAPPLSRADSPLDSWVLRALGWWRLRKEHWFDGQLYLLDLCKQQVPLETEKETKGLKKKSRYSDLIPSAATMWFQWV